MNILNQNFKISDDEIRSLRFPIRNILNEIQKEWIKFRERVCSEIIGNTNRDPKLIVFIRNSEWDITYSQVYYDGIFQGHLHEDPISLCFRFEPADVKNKNYPIYSKKF